MKAWVITTSRLDGRRSGIRVIGIVSARKRERHIKEHVQSLYGLLFDSLEVQMETARMHKPVPFPKVKVCYGVDVHVFASTTASVRAQLSEIINTRRDDEGRSWLKWKTPEYPIVHQDPDTYAVTITSVEKSKELEAPHADYYEGFRWDI